MREKISRSIHCLCFLFQPSKCSVLASKIACCMLFTLSFTLFIFSFLSLISCKLLLICEVILFYVYFFQSLCNYTNYSLTSQFFSLIPLGYSLIWHRHQPMIWQIAHHFWIFGQWGQSLFDYLFIYFFLCWED